MTATAGSAPTLAVSSATDSIRVAILAGRDPALLAAGRAAALGACARVVLALGGERQLPFIDRAEAIRTARPDAVLLLADARDADEAVDVAESLRLACDAQVPPPAVLVAADERTAARITASVRRATVAVPEPRAAGTRTAIVERLRAARRAAGDEVLRDELVERAARRLASSTSSAITVVDVTGSATSVVLARADGSIVAAHAPIGMGAAADRVVERVGLDRVRRWLPRAVDAPALLERVFNRAQWPDGRPGSALPLMIEMALARECIARVLVEAERASLSVASMRAPDTIACTGGLAAWRPTQTVLVALDALAPEGTTLIGREREGAPVVGGEADLEPLALAMALWPRRSTSVHLTDGTGAIDEPVARGAFFRIPTTGAVEVGGAGARSRNASAGLALGVVVDARGRPLELPPRDAERLPTLVRWHTALDALPAEDGA